MIYSEVKWVVEFNPVLGTWNCLLNLSIIINHIISKNIYSGMLESVYSANMSVFMKITDALMLRDLSKRL